MRIRQPRATCTLTGPWPWDGWWCLSQCSGFQSWLWSKYFCSGKTPRYVETEKCGPKITFEFAAFLLEQLIWDFWKLCKELNFSFVNLSSFCCGIPSWEFQLCQLRSLKWNSQLDLLWIPCVFNSLTTHFEFSELARCSEEGRKAHRGLGTSWCCEPKGHLQISTEGAASLLSGRTDKQSIRDDLRTENHRFLQRGKMTGERSGTRTFQPQ